MPQLRGVNLESGKYWTQNSMPKWNETEDKQPRFFRHCAVINDGGLEFGLRTLSGWIAIEGGHRLRNVTKWYYIPHD